MKEIYIEFRRIYSIGKLSNMKKGFTVLYAILVASLLLSISLGIYSISLRDFVLSSSASESEKAIFAADSGAECALYWDRVKKVFASRQEYFDGNVNNAGPGGFSQLRCGTTNNPNIYGGGGGSGTLSMGFGTEDYTQVIITLTNQLNDGPCAAIIVYKKPLYTQNLLTGNFDVYQGSETRIESRGYNTCDTANPRRVERAIEVRY